MKTQQESASREPGRGPLTKRGRAGALIRGLPSLQDCEPSISVATPSRPKDFVITAQTDEDIPQGLKVN